MAAITLHEVSGECAHRVPSSLVCRVNSAVLGKVHRIRFTSNPCFHVVYFRSPVTLVVKHGRAQDAHPQAKGLSLRLRA
jgi:hypothetical protein